MPAGLVEAEPAKHALPRRRQEGAATYQPVQHAQGMESSSKKEQLSSPILTALELREPGRAQADAGRVVFQSGSLPPCTVTPICPRPQPSHMLRPVGSREALSGTFRQVLMIQPTPASTTGWGV